MPKWTMLKRLRKDRSGNAMMLTAMAAPAIFGAAGLGIDVAQMYLYERELQYAADQAAIAGAWARANGDTGTYYKDRASREFTANVGYTSANTATVESSVEDYGTGGDDNSVLVTARITANLPFSKFILGRNTSIEVKAQATFEELEQYTPCLYALHQTASRALWFHGGPLVNARCGVGARSTASDAIVTSGNTGAQDIDFAVAGGGISDGAGAFGNGSVVENVENMVDPLEGVEAPTNNTPRELECVALDVSWQADQRKTTAKRYKYYQGRTAGNAKNNEITNYSGAQPQGSSYVDTLAMTFSYEPIDYTNAETDSGLILKTSAGANSIWERTYSTDSYAYTNKIDNTDYAGAMQPGTYEDFEISCDTTLASGIYVIDGGRFKVNAGYSLIGTGVLFVLKGGAQIEINGGAEISLTPMSALELVGAGVEAALADKLDGVLIFEDPDSEGSTGNSINGDAELDLNGVIYMPNSDMTISGSMHAESDCLMIMTSTLELAGNTNLTTLCPPGDENDVVVGGGGSRVRLVS